MLWTVIYRCRFNNLEIQFISLHLSLLVWSLFTVSSGLIGLVLLLVVHFGSILQRNTPFKKENGICPCCCSAADIYPVPYHQFWVNGGSEIMAMLVGNILLLCSETGECRKLLIPLSQIPRQRMAAGSLASDTRWVL